MSALVRAWRDLPRLREPDKFDAWLHRLLVNACLDEARRRRRRPIEVDLDMVRRQRETGIKGLGQVLKSFRDRSADFTVYDRMSGADAYLNNLGPLTMPTQGTRAGLGVNVRDIAFESMPKRAPGDVLGKSPSIRERN